MATCVLCCPHCRYSMSLRRLCLLTTLLWFFFRSRFVTVIVLPYMLFPKFSLVWLVFSRVVFLVACPIHGGAHVLVLSWGLSLVLCFLAIGHPCYICSRDVSLIIYISRINLFQGGVPGLLIFSIVFLVRSSTRLVTLSLVLSGFLYCCSGYLCIRGIPRSAYHLGCSMLLLFQSSAQSSLQVPLQQSCNAIVALLWQPSCLWF